MLNYERFEQNALVVHLGNLFYLKQFGFVFFSALRCCVCHVFRLPFNSDEVRCGNRVHLQQGELIEESGAAQSSESDSDDPVVETVRNPLRRAKTTFVCSA